MALTEPEKMSSSIFVFEPELRPDKTKTMGAKVNGEWKDLVYSENKGKLILTPSDYSLISRMAEECKKHPLINGYLGHPDKDLQISVFWKEYGLNFKTRPDVVIIDHDVKEVVILDVKSTMDSTPRGFASSINKFKYWSQAIMQIKGFESQGYTVLDYNWLVCDKNEYDPTCHVYRFPNEQQNIARQKFKDVCEKISEAQQSNLYPSYEQDLADEYGIIDLDITIY